MEGSKFFILKLSNFDMKVQFLYRRKLWTVLQNVIWKSEWTMLTFSWSEFEGITIYVNDKKLLCQQLYEYYKSEPLASPSATPSTSVPVPPNNAKSTSDSFIDDYMKEQAA